MLDYERWARSWSRFLGSQPSCDLLINLVVGWRYFPPGPRLLSQPEITALAGTKLYCLVTEAHSEKIIKQNIIVKTWKFGSWG